MVAWYWIIVAFVLGNAFTAFTYEWFEWDNIWTEIVATLAIIVLYPILAVYNVCFKNTIHPVSRERHEIHDFHVYSEGWRRRNGKLGYIYLFW